MARQMTSYEVAYTRKVNTFGFMFLAAHLPILCLLALYLGSSLGLVAGVMLLLLTIPGIVLLQDRNAPNADIAIAISAMGISALAIHVAGGIIEAHFELFVLIALLSVYGRVTPLLVAGATIALHHVLFWRWLPCSVFNYKAGFSVVLIHAFFVIFEVIPMCWIARQLGRSIQSQGIVLESLGSAAEQITTAAMEVSNSSQSLAQGAARQAASIEETSASTAEINSMARRNTENSQAAAVLMADSQIHFKEANQSLEEMVAAMNGINESGAAISKIIRIIDQIAFQTNILALNAAVEAARAGDAGMGFAVVAEEVRNLAHRSADAARDSAALIEDSMARSQGGRIKVEQVSAAIHTITSEFSRMKVLVEEINLGSEQQSGGIAQISRSMGSMEEITQSNAASAEQAAAAAAQLNAQADSIGSIVVSLSALSGSMFNSLSAGSATSRT